MPLVSIITPVYNAAKWLPETLASVEAQTLPDWEHILVDDGSTDGSIEVIQRAAARDPRIRLLRMSQNGGPGRSRNAAIGSATGRFIALLDADDLWLPQKLERCVAVMKKEGYGFAYHDYRHISRDGKKISRIVRGPEVLNYRTLHTRRGYGGCVTVMIDRAVIPDFHFPLEDRTLPEDLSAWIWLTRNGYVGHRIPEDLARYRLTESGRSSRKRRSALRTWRVYRYKEGLPFFKALYYWVQYGWNAFWLYRTSRPL